MAQQPDPVSWKRLTAAFGLMTFGVGVLVAACLPTVPAEVRAQFVVLGPALVFGGLGFLGVKQHQDAQAATLAELKAGVDDTKVAIRQDHAATLDVKDALAQAGVKGAGVP